MDKKTFKDTKNKVWPSTKRDLQKAIATAKKLIDKGEKHIKIISEKSIRSTKVISLNLKKEQIYYLLGKNVAQIGKSKWAKDKKVNNLLLDLKAINSEIKKLSK